MREIIIKNPEEDRLIKSLEARTDIKAERIKRLLRLPDLTKKENSPIKILVDQITKSSRFSDFDLVDFPRIVTVEQCLDLLNMPEAHPSRKETDTYFLDSVNILRTQTTAFWSFYLNDQKVLNKLKEDGYIGALCPGIIFRKDEVDRHHMNFFHQIDGLYICRKDQKIITQQDLKDAQVDLAKSIFGSEIEYKFIDDNFPYTVQSLEMDIMFKGEWMEVNGAGIVNPIVMKNFGIDPEIYNGWAFGFGLDRLAMVKMEIPDIRILWSEDPRITSQFKDINSKFKEVSKYPEITRDISFIISKNINLNNYFEIVRDYAENIIEEVKQVDEYIDDDKFGVDKKSYTFRIVYRSHERTLTNEEVNKIQDQIIAKTKDELNVAIR